MYMRDNQFKILRHNVTVAAELLRALSAPNKRSKRPKFDYVKNKWWELKTLEELMDAWRWQIYFDEAHEDVVNIDFTGENFGDDETMLQTIAPAVEPDSYIEMENEEGYLWRWKFDGEDVYEIEPTITWD